MADRVKTTKRWFARRRRRRSSVQADEFERQFNAVIDRLADHRDHIVDRIEGSGKPEG